jgi:membrane protein implicated in regulation of membrane protease activity
MLIIVAVVLLIFLPGPWNWVAFVVVTLLWFVELYGWNRKVRGRRREVGAETLIGQTAVVTQACRPSGQVRLNGEIWEARCDAGAGEGEQVRVVGRDELLLVVEPVS